MPVTKSIKIIGYILLGIVGLLVATGATVYGLSQRRLNQKQVVVPLPVAIPVGATAVERGRHIVQTRSCSDCHGKDFGGAKVVDDPAAGVFYGPNLTSGQGGLPSDFRDEDYVRAIRHGLARDGRPLVLMPSQEYTDLTDEDLGAVIAYLKQLAPVDRPRGPIKPGPAIRVLMLLGQFKLAAEEIDHGKPRAATIQAGVTPEYGAYLAASCTGCHGVTLSGGKIAGAPPDWPAAANLTALSPKVPRWTEEQFFTILRKRIRPDGTAINPIMPAAIGDMTDMELKALYGYICSLPPMETGKR